MLLHVDGPPSQSPRFELPAKVRARMADRRRGSAAASIPLDQTRFTTSAFTET